MESNKKYRYTRQLINMALRDGWTQNQIADACRTQQSVVSSWKNGATQAKESQLVKLLEVYGPKLRRKSFKIYHAFQKDDCDELSVQIRAHFINDGGAES
jgi:transcriptional regulator with XRE-family HTH domain